MGPQNLGTQSSRVIEDNLWIRAAFSSFSHQGVIRQVELGLELCATSAMFSSTIYLCFFHEAFCWKCRNHSSRKALYPPLTYRISSIQFNFCQFKKILDLFLKNMFLVVAVFRKFKNFVVFLGKFYC